ncbi:MAG TPA: nuclear transport factor 2 family protein [Candidatus Angelobacter sp.]|nr:nuclear transport factor 2 family protein [Candidatus Angelobacter sp.]
MSSISKLESRAVNVARAHIEAWSSHDYEKARKSLADDVHVTVTTTQPIMPATDTVGIDKYMDGLVKFASAVEPGSVRIIGSTGDDHNALLLVTMKTALGPGGTNVMLSGARLYLIDDQGKISAEQVIFFVGSG